MFSGIVEEVGTIVGLTDSGEGKTILIEAPLVTEGLSAGDSVSVSGVCLTAVTVDGSRFSTDAMFETLRRSKLNALNVGGKVNLERALAVSARLGGHLVSGHVDAIARVVSVVPDGFASIVTFALENAWAPYFVEKGSVAIDGVSLTVIDCDSIAFADSAGEFKFTVGLIPHTMQVTTLGGLAAGDCVNIETDVVARYVVRLIGPFAPAILKDLSKVLSAAAPEILAPV